jgi:hypothetical protein
VLQKNILDHNKTLCGIAACGDAAYELLRSKIFLATLPVIAGWDVNNI